MRYITLIILFLSTISLFPQNFKGGVIGGVSTSQVSGDNLGGYNKASLFIGVFTELPITNISNVKMEMNYIGKGSHNPKMLENGFTDNIVIFPPMKKVFSIDVKIDQLLYRGQFVTAF